MIRPVLLGERLQASVLVRCAGTALISTALRLVYPAVALLVGTSRAWFAVTLLVLTMGAGSLRAALVSSASQRVRSLLFRRIARALREAPAVAARTADAEQLQTSFARGLPWVEAYVTTTLPTLAGYLLALPLILAAAAAQLGWGAATLAIVAIAIAGGLGVYTARRAAAAATLAWEQYQPIAALLETAIKGTAELRAHGLEQRVEGKLAELVERWSISERSAQFKASATSFGVPAVAVLVAVSTSALFGGHPLAYAEAAVRHPDRQAVVAGIILLSAIPTLWGIARSATDIGLERRYLATLERFVARCTATRPASLPSENSVGDIELKAVTYAYPDASNPSVSPFAVQADFVWRAGETLALVGPNGSGKTTIALLVLGLLAPSSGTVIRSAGSVGTSRSRLPIAYLPQHPFWEKGTTIAEAVRFAAPEATDNDIVKLLEQLWSPSTRQKMGELLFQPVDALSVGERQLVAIARALLRDADLTVMDEPEASLDAEARQRVADVIVQHLGGRSVLLLTHDKIIIAAAGRAIQVGQCTPASATPTRAAVSA